MLQTFINIVHVFVCLVLVGVVLLQQGKGGGMGAAFGGASSQVFGGRGAGNILTRATAICAAIFMLTSVSLAYLSSSGDRALKAKIAAEAGRTKERGELKERTLAPLPLESESPSSDEAPVVPEGSSPDEDTGEAPADTTESTTGEAATDAPVVPAEPAAAPKPAAPAPKPAAPAPKPAGDPPAEAPAKPAGEAPAEAPKGGDAPADEAPTP